MPPVPPRHTIIRYDPDDGQPYDAPCDCEIGDLHNGLGQLLDPERLPAAVR